MKVVAQQVVIGAPSPSGGWVCVGARITNVKPPATLTARSPLTDAEVSNYVDDLTSHLHAVGLPQARINQIAAKQPHALGMDGIETFSVDVDGSSVGYVALTPTTDGFAHVLAVMVPDAHIASAVTALAAHARRLGVSVGVIATGESTPWHTALATAGATPESHNMHLPLTPGDHTSPLTLTPKTPTEYTTHITRLTASYATDLITTGANPDTAHSAAHAHITALLPDGQHTPGHTFYNITNKGEYIGDIHLYTHQTWAYLYDIRIHETHQGHGHGTTTLHHAHHLATTHGAHTIGLNVFHHNTGAHRLYRKLGYHPTFTQYTIHPHP